MYTILPLYPILHTHARGSTLFSLSINEIYLERSGSHAGRNVCAVVKGQVGIVGTD